MKEEAPYARVNVLEGGVFGQHQPQVFLRACFAFLVGGAVLPTFAARRHRRRRLAYSSALSVAICIVAALHYHEIQLRDRQPSVSVDGGRAAARRLGDHHAPARAQVLRRHPGALRRTTPSSRAPTSRPSRPCS